MRQRAFRGCLIVLFLLGGTGISVSKDVHSKPPNDNVKLNGAGENPQGAAPAPIIVNVPAPQKTAEEKEEDAKERAEKSSNDGKIVEFTRQLANYTFGLLVATGALVLATAALAYLGREQSRDMKSSLAIADKSAETAKKSADALPIVERAYVFLDNDSQTHVVQYDRQGPGTAENSWVSFSFKNVGRTPAIIKHVRANLAYFLNGSIPSIEGTDAIDFFNGTIIAANTIAMNKWYCTFLLSKEQLDNVDVDKSAHVFFWGKVVYEDIFGNSHETGFCYELKFGNPRLCGTEYTELNYHT